MPHEGGEGRESRRETRLSGVEMVGATRLAAELESGEGSASASARPSEGANYATKSERERPHDYKASD